MTQGGTATKWPTPSASAQVAGGSIGDSGVLEVDMLIVGAGPAGLYGAYYAGFRGLSVAVMDILPEPGGQVSALYPEKRIYDVAGLPGVRGQALVDRLLEQVAPFSPAYLLGHQAEAIEHGVDGAVTVTSAQGAVVRAGAVVITGGVGSFWPRPLQCGIEYEGRGLSYFVPRLEDFRDMDVVVVGGGDSAVDWALALQGIARSVTLVHRRNNFRAHEHSVEQLRNSSTRLILDAEVSALHGEGRVSGARVSVKGHEQALELPAQGVIAALGFKADLGPLERWGLTLDRRRVVVDTTMHTGVDRVFAAGDITTYPGKVKLISVGFGEAALAVNNAATALHPGSSLEPGHSTHGAPVPAA